jgi:recombinational DNA repair protein RecR
MYARARRSRRRGFRPATATRGWRTALFLIKKREQIMTPLAAAMQTALEKIEICRVCGNIDTQSPCTECTDVRRDGGIIVVVADVTDLRALERAHAVNARYQWWAGRSRRSTTSARRILRSMRSSHVLTIPR